MTRVQKNTLVVLFTIACSLSLVVVDVGLQTYQIWSQQPLGPTLAHPTEWRLPATWTASPATLQPTVRLVPTLTFETQTPASPLQACNNLPTMTLLAIGTDARSDEYGHG